jgi:transposase
MPKRLRIEAHLSVAELKERYLKCQEVRERSHWEVIWLLSTGTPSEWVANRTHLTVDWVRLLAQRYNQQGPEALGDRRRQHPGRSRLLTLCQQEELQAALEQPVPEELGGGLWNGPKVAAWMSQVLGRPVQARRGHAYLQHVGYTCQSPRPHHTGPHHTAGDPQAQEAFKKSWRKP